jgi:small subunit ribosomal protein S20
LANTPSAEKRIRRNDRRADVNKARKSRIRTFVKRVESAIESGVRADATAALAAAQPE